MYSDHHLILFDADGTTIDAFSALDRTFAAHGMDIGDLERFQKRRNLFKYLGGLREFPVNLRKQFGKQKRKRLLATLTEVYREEALLYPGLDQLIQTLLARTDVRVGLVTRNISNDPELTLKRLFERHGIDLDALDYMVRIPIGDDKAPHFRAARERFRVNPARSYACGDEFKDYRAAVDTGMHPFVVSYGFEDYKRLTQRFGVPGELISRTPSELCQRIGHALGL